MQTYSFGIVFSLVKSLAQLHDGYISCRKFIFRLQNSVQFSMTGLLSVVLDGSHRIWCHSRLLQGGTLQFVQIFAGFRPDLQKKTSSTPILPRSIASNRVVSNRATFPARHIDGLENIHPLARVIQVVVCPGSSVRKTLPLTMVAT